MELSVEFAANLRSRRSKRYWYDATLAAEYQYRFRIRRNDDLVDAWQDIFHCFQE